MSVSPEKPATFTRPVGSAMVQIDEEFELGRGQPPERIVLHSVEERFDIRPIVFFLFNKPSKIDNHNSCLCLTLMYWERRSIQSRSWSTRAK